MRTVDAIGNAAADNQPALPDVSGDEQSPWCAPLPVVPDQLRDELHRQGRELAEHLRREASAIDRRESQTHAQIAEIEQQARSVNLSAIEYSAQLDRRCDELDALARALAVREANLAGAERFLDEARHQLDQRLAELPGARADGRENADDDSACLDSPAVNSGEWLEIEQAWLALHDRRIRLADDERRVVARTRSLEEARARLAGQVREMFARLTAERSQVARQTAAIKRGLARRMTALEQRREGLSRLQVKLLQQRESLEAWYRSRAEIAQPVHGSARINKASPSAQQTA
jgi:hypothetical protein